MISLYAALVSQAPPLSGPVVTLCRDVSNAESIVFSGTQRLFVTGREGVYELLGPSDDDCDKKRIPVRVKGVPKRCMKNGIAAHGDYLYLACAHVMQGNNPLLNALMDDVNELQQTLTGLLRLSLAAMTYPVESWIVRCDLRQMPLAFTELVAGLPGNILANGIAISTDGGSLYVANSGPSISTGIYRVPTDADGDGSKAGLWCRPPGCKPNGLKVKGQTLYYSGNTTPAAVLGSVPINDDGSAGEPRVIYTGPFHLFDDFETVKEGFVITQFSNDYMGVSTGSLRIVSMGGRELAVLKRQEIDKPCAVAVAKTSGTLFAAGDVLIVDKGVGGVLLFKPDDPWRDWLQAAPS